MTTVKDLPEEVLHDIFAKVDRSDLKACQKACRSWYSPAHLLLLKEISFTNTFAIGAFIRSIDCNPHPSYLKAVKTLEFSDWDEVDYQFDKEMIRNLFLRFPNLRKIAACNYSALFKEFDQELCSEIAKSCPNIESFSVATGNGNMSEYLALLYKLRLLLTEVDAKMVDYSVSRFEDVVQFITSFPRLQEIYGYSDQINSLHLYLDIFEHIDKLVTISLTETVTKERNYAKRLLEAKPKNVQDLIIQRLSKVKKLDWRNPQTLSLNSIDFAGEYFNGLKDFSISGKFDDAWTKYERQAFWNSIVSLLENIRNHAYIHLSAIQLDYLKTELADVIQQIFHQTATFITERTLNINIPRLYSTVGLASLTIRSFERRNPAITLEIRDELSLYQIITDFSTRLSPIDCVDSLVLTISYRYLTQDDGDIITICFYDQMLQGLPSVKNVTFDIPEWYTDVGTGSTFHQQVETLTLRAAKNAKFPHLLDHFASALPSLKRLNLYYSSGVWEEHLGEFQVNLGEYSLEKLSIDVTPVKIKMAEMFNRPISMEEDFFVVELELLSKSEHHLYKVSLDLQTASTIDIEDPHSCKNYLRVHVVINCLQNFQIGMYLPSVVDRDTYFHGPYWYNVAIATLFK